MALNRVVLIFVLAAGLGSAGPALARPELVCHRPGSDGRRFAAAESVPIIRDCGGNNFVHEAVADRNGRFVLRLIETSGLPGARINEGMDLDPVGRAMRVAAVALGLRIERYRPLRMAPHQRSALADAGSAPPAAGGGFFTRGRFHRAEIRAQGVGSGNEGCRDRQLAERGRAPPASGGRLPQVRARLALAGRHVSEPEEGRRGAGCVPTRYRGRSESPGAVRSAGPSGDTDEGLADGSHYQRCADQSRFQTPVSGSLRPQRRGALSTQRSGRRREERPRSRASGSQTLGSARRVRSWDGSLGQARLHGRGQPPATVSRIGTESGGCRSGEDAHRQLGKTRDRRRSGGTRNREFEFAARRRSLGSGRDEGAGQGRAHPRARFFRKFLRRLLPGARALRFPGFQPEPHGLPPRLARLFRRHGGTLTSGRTARRPHGDHAHACRWAAARGNHASAARARLESGHLRTALSASSRARKNPTEPGSPFSPCWAWTKSPCRRRWRRTRVSASKFQPRTPASSAEKPGRAFSAPGRKLSRELWRRPSCAICAWPKSTRDSAPWAPIPRMRWWPEWACVDWYDNTRTCWEITASAFALSGGDSSGARRPAGRSGVGEAGRGQPA